MRLCRKAVEVAVLLCIAGMLFYTDSQRTFFPTDNTETRQHLDIDFPRKLWQTWQTFEESPQGLSEENQRLSETWKHVNPDHRYELLTTGSASTFVREHFQDQPDIIETFERLGDPILQVNLIRYIALLAEGGVYADLDTDCTRPISSWIPPEFLNRTNVVLGIEYDARGEEMRQGMPLPAQLCQCTLMSKPGHPVIEHMLNRVVTELKILGDGHEQIIPKTTDDVMDTSGPRVFTTAVLEALTIRTGRRVTFEDLSFIDTPKLIGGVLILPVSAFASGQEHSASKQAVG